ncbi:hypothetical protein [Candidatus Kryptobacter tengchongensis]|uniref:VOC domain-containing protein n=1 Tax=Kryptobacter tengchongensis TaxID=1643429 RepID=A0A916PHX0_KRYT1|nr:hypothetical protein [Candidatus Kryptobacter tengchongensis]CUS96987.1 hypothetical protein JGI25_00194 [Candidatus Kryptobacter tengchongensis]
MREQRRKGIKITPELIEEIRRLIDERFKVMYVERSDFEDLKDLVKQIGQNMFLLAEAQRKTEERLDGFEKATEENFKKVWESINQLAEAQRRTEERLNAFEKATEENFKRVWESINQLTIRVDQLAEAQRKTEERLNQLTIRVDQLAEAQRKTEERLNAFEKATEENFKRVWESINQLTIRVDQLAEAQRRTEERLNQLTIRVDQLAEAQRKTEERLNQLISEHQRTREILAGISDTVGYGLEDKVMVYMREFARDEYGVEAEIVERRNVVYPDGRYDEVNIYVEGRKNGQKVYLIGECKSRPSKGEIDKLSKKRDRLRNYFNADVYAFIVAYYFSPEVENYLREEHPDIKMVKSYEFEMRYGRKV